MEVHVVGRCGSSLKSETAAKRNSESSRKPESVRTIEWSLYRFKRQPEISSFALQFTQIMNI